MTLPAPEKVDEQDPGGAAEVTPRKRWRVLPLRWWREVLYAAAFYGIYSVIRNTQGSATVSAAHAMRNALRVIRLEENLWLYHERAIQEPFLDNAGFIEFWNLFYGSFHFVVTVVALVLLYRRFPQRYRKWRNTLAFTTGFALIGFATYPLMPPRLLPSSYGFVDTLKVYGSLWSFDSGAVHKISNQYAAMPSLHFAWAMWSTLVLVPALKRNWAKILAVLYPAFTLFAIVVTANHFIIDAVAGAFILGVGALAGFALAARVNRRLKEEEAEAGPPDPPPPEAQAEPPEPPPPEAEAESVGAET